MASDFDFGAAFKHLRAQGQPPNMAMRNALHIGGKTLRGVAAKADVSKEWLDKAIDTYPTGKGADRARAKLLAIFKLSEAELWPGQEAA